MKLLEGGGGGGGGGGGRTHRQKSWNEILPGVDLQILLLIEQIVWCFASEFVC